VVKPPATKVPDDGMEHVIYGRVLTLYQLEQKSKAKKALREAPTSCLW